MLRRHIPQRPQPVKGAILAPVVVRPKLGLNRNDFDPSKILPAFWITTAEPTFGINGWLIVGGSLTLLE